MAEAEKAIVVVPVVLEVAEVELPVAVRVPVEVRHPVVAIGAMRAAPSFFTESNTGRSLYFILSHMLNSAPRRLD
ncbi:hypothetical protein HY798_00920 [Candidatus Falkowbacteria bacterium]|nr:hypothetical protein [Candidatus Falkowbacteria bacterium]